MNIQIRALRMLVADVIPCSTKNIHIDEWQLHTRKIIHFTDGEKKSQPIHCSMTFLAENRKYNIHMNIARVPCYIWILMAVAH